MTARLTPNQLTIATILAYASVQESGSNASATSPSASPSLDKKIETQRIQHLNNAGSPSKIVHTSPHHNIHQPRPGF